MLTLTIPERERQGITTCCMNESMLSTHLGTECTKVKYVDTVGLFTKL